MSAPVRATRMIVVRSFRCPPDARLCYAAAMPKPRSDSLAIAVLLTGLVAFGPLSTDLYLPALPGLVDALETDVASVQLTLSVFLAGFAVSQLLYGPLSDRFGRRPLLIAGVTVFTLASIACALAPTIEALIAARFVQALGACCGPVLARAVVRDVYGRERAASVLAYMSMAMALAPAIGPVLGGVITGAVGWRANFWLLVGFGVIIWIAVVALLAETNAHRDPRATDPTQLLRNYGTLLRHRAYVGYLLVLACAYSIIFTFISGSSYVFIETLGLSPVGYGLCFSAIVVGYMTGTLMTGRLTQRVGLDRLLGLGVGVAGVGAAAMLACALAGLLSVVTIVGPFALVMVGVGLIMPNAMAGAIGPFPRMAGAASALMGFCQMGLAALVGIVVGAAADGSARPMAISVSLMAVGAAAAFTLLVRARRDSPAGAA